MRRLFLTALTLCLVCTLSACAPRQQSGRTPEDREAANILLDKYGSPAPPPEVLAMPAITPDAMCEAWEADRLATDERYRDRWVKVQGTLIYGPTSKGMEGLHVAYVGLGNKGKSMAFLFFGNKQQAQLGAVRKGQTLTIAGTYVTGEKHLPKLIGCTLLRAE